MKRFVIAALAIVLSVAPASAGNEYYASVYNHSDAYVLMTSKIVTGAMQSSCVRPSSTYSHRYTVLVEKITVELMHKDCAAPVMYSASYLVRDAPSYAVTVEGYAGKYRTSGTSGGKASTIM